MSKVLTTSINRTVDDWDALQPVFSAVFACYKVAAYLPEMLASLDAQTIDPDLCELIFVIDGCPEDSEGVVRQWMDGTRFPVRVISKENGGVASARNAGVSYARGEWITTPDPDDWLAPDYFEQMLVAAQEFADETMFVARIQMKSAGGRNLEHPLDYRNISTTPRLVDLQLTPRDIHTLGGVVFVNRALLVKAGLRFDENIAQASDTHFVARFLLLNGAKYVLVPGAVYEYRQRADSSGLVASQIKQISRHLNTFGYTHSDLISAAKVNGDEIPQWLANVMLYFTFMLFRRDLRGDTITRSYDPEDLKQVREHIRSNLKTIGPSNIAGFNVIDLAPAIRGAWLAACDALDASRPYVLNKDHGANRVRLGIITSSGATQVSVAPISAAAPISQSFREIRILGELWCYELVLLMPGTTQELPSLIVGQSTVQASQRPEDAFVMAHEEADKSYATEQAVAQKVSGLRALYRAGRRLYWQLSGRKAYWVVNYNADHQKKLVALVQSLATASGKRSVHVIASAKQLDKAKTIFEGIRVVPRDSAEHRFSLEHARFNVVVSVNAQTILPFGSEPLPKSGSIVYFDAGAKIDRAVLPSVDLVITESQEERALFTGPRSEYSFTEVEVKLISNVADVPGTVKG
ncbi:glycosyltransferase involved in cell wall biosynthesis [Leucobacter exalbidus]|uniref:Glycosyltransferase involved in cell wall biosynthesis n=1 Tax=Leucobacter exalbidus TaxID=662960 RepID=A0A940T3F0_9MICO|nr:glycosyltransferase family A protein [Leucobacter exalbidus]MBP1326087.1 glycosyltransferase involved in cell wall biosynthesis [Leucobacter exalbidus]